MIRVAPWLAAAYSWRTHRRPALGRAFRRGRQKREGVMVVGVCSSARLSASCGMGRQENLPTICAAVFLGSTTKVCPPGACIQLRSLVGERGEGGELCVFFVVCSVFLCLPRRGREVAGAPQVCSPVGRGCVGRHLRHTRSGRRASRQPVKLSRPSLLAFGGCVPTVGVVCHNPASPVD